MVLTIIVLDHLLANCNLGGHSMGHIFDWGGQVTSLKTYLFFSLCKNQVIVQQITSIIPPFDKL